ncbi:MAG: manganese efflux pump MntP family protein [Oscillospiraceae bacterium]
MGIAGIILLAAGLAMDAFAVSVCKGLSLGRIKLKHAATVGAWFGSFQAVMPLLGYLLGSTLSQLVSEVDHWIACVLLAIIGGNMVREALSRDDDEDLPDPSLSFSSMLMPAVATSIDALAVGVTFAFLDVPVLFASGVIGAVTFLLSALGVKLGSICGAKYKSKAELAGGIVLILLGLKILAEGLGWL